MSTDTSTARAATARTAGGGSESGFTETPTYAPGRLERNGWVLGLSGPQLLLCIAAVVPLLLLLGAGAVGTALLLLPVMALVVALVVVPIRGRPALRWLTDAARYALGAGSGWASFQSAAAAGLPVDPDEPDLPGELSRFEWLHGPTMPEQGRVCVLHDTAEARWGATARLAARGVGLTSVLEQKVLARGLGRMLAGLADSERVDRASLLVRTVPDDGTAYQHWAAAHVDPGAPEFATGVLGELQRSVAPGAVAQEAFLTVSAREEVLRRPARAAGGGAAGYAYVLHRALGALTAPLQEMGSDRPTWLDQAGVMEAIRTGYNPAVAGRLSGHRLAHGGESGLVAAAAGPSRAPAPPPRSYSHDGFVTVSYAVIPPRAGIKFGALGPLLAVHRRGERRSLAIHYEVLPRRMAQRIARNERATTTLVSEMKAAKGFGTAAADTQDRGASYRQEDAVAAGEAMCRYAVVVSVTVPAGWNVEDHAEALETAAAGRYQLVRLELAQDTGFVAATLPVGLGLDRLRTTI